MAIKRIPIKGISRDPSGQISAEGMCAESFNVQLDMGEVAPMVKPKNLLDEYVGDDVDKIEYEPLFIHKGSGRSYKNLICRDSNTLRYYPGGTAISGFTLASDETIQDIKSVGNTLIVSTSEDVYYFLYENGYKYLGTKIPIPSISFRMGDITALRSEPEADTIVFPTEYPVNPVDPEQFQVIEAELKAQADAYYDWIEEKSEFDPIDFTTEWGGVGTNYKVRNDNQQGFLDEIWGVIDKAISDAGNSAPSAKAIFPFFVRYAVRLYDGTCSCQSIPVLIGAELLKYLSINVLFYERKATPAALTTSSDPYWKSRNILMATLALPEAFSLYATFPGSTFSDWKDIVTGVDIFISDQFIPVNRNSIQITQSGSVQGYDMENPLPDVETLSCRYLFGEGNLDPYYMETHQDELVMLHQATYLAKSYTTDEFDALSGEICLSDINYSADYIASQEALIEASQSMHHIKSKDLFTYNNRLLSCNSVQVLSHGYPFIHSAKWETGSVTNVSYQLIYYIKSDNGDACVISRNADGTANKIYGQNVEIISGITSHEVPVAWFAYPDSRCYKISIIRTRESDHSVYSITIPMKAASTIDVAYAFIGFGKELSWRTVSVRPYENPNIDLGNKIIVSKANNPFVFRAQDQVTLNVGEIRNLAVATTPLSEGQAGQFPLYVFTDEGVFALTVNSVGDLVYSHAVTQDVILSKDSLCAIEQGVFFAAARGLLLLQGSRVEKMSTLMDGPVDTIEDSDLVASIQGIIGESITYEAGSVFHEFLNESMMVYDYANKRIIIFRTDTPSSYIYKFDTQSWHRMKTSESMPVRALNSYPEASIVSHDSEGYSLMDYSVFSEDEEAEALPGLIYTRELSLDEHDLYKTINRLKIRGRFRDGNVKWVLQGSNDGSTYFTLHSLRGPSWKWYRIAMVTNLAANERISYIELDSTPKFTNKLR